MRQAGLFLKLVTERFPPEGETRHNLNMEGDKFILAVNMGDHWQTFVLDEGDMDAEPSDVVDAIAAMMPEAEATWRALCEAKTKGLQ